MNKPKKYRSNYSDAAIKNCLDALKFAQMGNSIFMSKTTSEQDYLLRRKYLLSARGLIENIPTISYIFLEHVRKNDSESNEKKTKITRFETESFEFLKKRIFISGTGKIVMRLTRENIRKRRQKLKKHKKLLDAGKISFESIAQSYQSWRGYAQKYNTYNTIKNMDKLYKELFGKEIR